MSWQGIEGHDAIVEKFRTALERERLASTYLFVGPSGVGKCSFAVKLAQVLLCQRRRPVEMEPCGECDACALVEAMTHPDLHLVAKPPEKSEIPVDLLIGERERRMQEGLCHDIGLKPYLGPRKVAIVDDADHLNEEGANCLLKTLEEPPPRSVLILIGTSAERQLPTIRSRCQMIYFRPLDAQVVARLVLASRLVENEADAQRLARSCGGSLQRAVELADEPLWAFRRQLLTALAESDWDSVRLARAAGEFVEAAGREGAAKRRRARQIIAFCEELYTEVMREIAGAAQDIDVELRDAATRVTGGGSLDVETAADCLERCAAAIRQIDGNAQQTTVLDCLFDDLARLSAPRAQRF